MRARLLRNVYWIGLFCFGVDAVERSPIIVGVQGGMSFANATTPANISSSTYTGFAAGLNADIFLNEFLSLQPEALLIQRGANLTDTAGVRVDARLTSIEVPVLLKAKLVTENVTPFLFAGPTAIFNISRKVEGVVAGQTGAVALTPERWDFAATFGGGVDVGPVFTNLRFSLGLIDVDERTSDWRSRGFQLLLGLRLGA